MTSAASDPGASREEGAPRISLGQGRALVPVPPAPKSDFLAGLGRSHGFVAASVAVVMGLGFVAATAVFASKPQAVVVAQAAPPADTTMDVLYRVQGEVRSLRAGLDALRASAEDGRQTDTIRALKKSVDVLRGDLDGVKTASAGAVGQLGAKIDRLDRDPGPKLNEIVARLDKLDRDPDAKLGQVATQLAARLDRVERQVASADATGAIPAPAAVTGQSAAAAAAVKAPLPPTRVPPQPAPAAAVAPPAPVAVVPPARPEAPARNDGPKAEAARVEPPKSEPAKAEAAAHPDASRQEALNRPATLDGWLLRDVYDGVALVEGRAGGLREVSPGDRVPGVGEIRSIERRGRGWVVVTSRGIIQADNRW